MKILLVEDDAMVADGLSYIISKASYKLEHVTTISLARAALKNTGIGLIILDLSLPDGDGLSLLRELREQGNDTPILLLTARSEPRDKVLGLDSGADDYLAKPFDRQELVARVRALMRRSMGRSQAMINYGRLVLYPDQVQVTLDNQSLELPLRQYRLLQYLLESQGRVKTKQQIIDALYGWDQDIEENTIEVYISQLRKQLWPNLIKTLRGIGYVVPPKSLSH